MFRYRRSRRLVAGIATAAGCVAMALPSAPVRAQTPAAPPVEEELVSGALDLLAGDAVAEVAAAPRQLDASLRPTASGIRVALVSSGVDISVLPESLRGRIGLLGSGGDPVGYGTYVASVLLQLDPGARITSIGVYPNGRFHPDWQAGALEWAKINARNLDAVLYAVPPTEFLDPVSATMAAGQWDATADAISDHASVGSRGPVFGVPLWGNLRSALTRDMPPSERALVDRFSALTARWAGARAQIRAINAAGVSVVAPAGDQGPGPQTVFGIANFPEVVAVGAADGPAISPTSASGPSMDGRVKPDLAAPSGLVGLLPPASALARSLGARGLLDSALEPVWDAGTPLTDARARLASTMVPAAVVAAATGGMAAEGLRDVARQRGALTAASVPLPGVAVWRQGAGVLRRVPDAAFAASRPLALAHGDLGMEPDTGSWSAPVAFTAGAAGASTALTDRQGVGPDARPALAPVTPTEAPPVSATAGAAGVEISVPLGDGAYQGGLYCGFTEVSVPLTDDTVDPGVDVHGIPEGTEQVPTCLVKGNRLRGHAFYIHDTPAENLTFGLLPALAAGEDLLHHGLMLLPVDPLATKLFFKVTGADGNAMFPNVPPGYYKIRQWSDYGSPVREVVDGAAKDHDIGESVAYQSFEALVLPGACTDDTPQGNNAATPGPCEQTLNQAFGDENVSFDKPTLGYLVTTGPRTLRVVFDRFKKMPGAGVTSRYIDQINPVRDLKFTSVDLPAAFSAGALASRPATDKLPANPWSFVSPVGDASRATASVSPTLSGSGTKVNAGVTAYPFALTTPNYKAHMSLNFSYELNNAAIVVAVVVGKSVHYGVVTPTGTVTQPSLGLTAPMVVPPTRALLRSTGTANFEFHMLPRGASQGTLYLAFVPAYQNTAVSTATLDDLSFELDTWNNTLWPATTFAGDPVVRGHSFTVRSNYSTRQLVPGEPCRDGICEDWEVMVHSPGDDAATFDVVDTAHDVSLMGDIRSGGGGLFDPARGVHDFTHLLSFATPTVAATELPIDIANSLKTNGRFWEQLSIPGSVLSAHPGPLEMRIVDDSPGRLSPLLPHADGPVPVAPYRPLRNTAMLLEAPTTGSLGL